MNNFKKLETEIYSQFDSIVIEKLCQIEDKLNQTIGQNNEKLWDDYNEQYFDLETDLSGTIENIVDNCLEEIKKVFSEKMLRFERNQMKKFMNNE